MLQDAFSPQYLASGHLLFARGTGLWAAPFDTERLALAGEPVAVVDNVEISIPVPAASYDTADDGTLVFTPGRGQQTVVLSDRNGREEALVGVLPGTYSHVAVSPDGTRVALVIGNPGDIGIYDLARHTLTRLTTNPDVDTGPAWSPDSRRVAFSSTHDAAGPRPFEAQVDGTGSEAPIGPPNGPPLVPEEWLSDGSGLLGWINSGSGGADIGILVPGVDPTLEVLIDTPFVDTAPTLSPDGRWLAFHSDRSGQSSRSTRDTVATIRREPRTEATSAPTS